MAKLKVYVNTRERLFKPKLSHYKSYEWFNSPLFKIRYEKALFLILCTTDEIFSIINNKIFYYNMFEIEGRVCHTPCYELKGLHSHLAQFLVRIKKPRYLYSGVKGLSYVDNARVHSVYYETFKTDISEFYSATTQAIVFKFFRNKMQCSHKVANILAELCTLEGKLPTGSQLSMILAFWANSDMFEQLNQLAQEHHLVMTVYVDDITFSGAKIPAGFRQQVAQIMSEHGHAMNKKKTRLYQANSHKEITGLIINRVGDSPIPPNRFYLKLHNKLAEFNQIYAEIKNGKSKMEEDTLRQLTNHLIGLLNHASQFDKKYKMVKKHIQKQHDDLIQYLQTTHKVGSGKLGKLCIR